MGYVEVTLSIDEGLPKCHELTCLFLVAPDTKFSASTPLIPGTNILQELLQDCKDNHEPQYLQRAGLHTPWYLCFRVMVLREKKLEQNNGKIGVVKCASAQKITLHPNQSVNVRGYIDQEMSYPDTTVILQETDDSTLRPWLDLEPSVIHFRYKHNDEVIVNLPNLTTQTVTIQPRAVLCELQPVSVAEETFRHNEEQQRREEILTSLKIDEEDLLDEEQKAKLMALMRKHEDLFSLGDTDIGVCTLIKHRVDLLDDSHLSRDTVGYHQP